MENYFLTKMTFDFWSTHFDFSVGKTHYDISFNEDAKTITINGNQSQIINITYGSMNSYQVIMIEACHNNNCYDDPSIHTLQLSNSTDKPEVLGFVALW